MSDVCTKQLKLAWLNHQTVCREWSPEERAVWQERDAHEQAELAGHANAPTTLQDLHLPGTCNKVFSHVLSRTGGLFP